MAWLSPIFIFSFAFYPLSAALHIGGGALELRSGHRLRPMMPEGESAPTAPSPAPTAATPASRFLLRQHHPPRGDSIDVDDWILQVERASNHNNWDPPMRLSNVVFCLSDTAVPWFENNGALFDTWETFKRLIIAAFGQGEQRKRRAIRYLSTRHKAYGEPFSSYMADIPGACRKAEPCMTEAGKIHHLLKGLSQQLFNAVALIY